MIEYWKMSEKCNQPTTYAYNRETTNLISVIVGRKKKSYVC